MQAERRLIPAHELRSGSRVFVEPHHAADIPRAAKLDAIDAAGQWMTVNDYVFGLVARGAVVAWSGEKVAAAPVQEKPQAVAPVLSIVPRKGERDAT